MADDAPPEGDEAEPVFGARADAAFCEVFWSGDRALLERCYRGIRGSSIRLSTIRFVKSWSCSVAAA
jgi:hypothetical protein